MAWTTPRTWVTGELVTSAMLNTHVRDNLNYLYAGGEFGYASGTIASLANDTYTDVPLTGQTYVTGAVTISSPNMTAGVAGYYDVRYVVSFAANITGERGVLSYAAGSAVHEHWNKATQKAAVTSRIHGHYVTNITAGQSVKIAARQDSGGTLATTGWLWMTRLG